MDQVKRLIFFKIPMSICNFRCHYCYLSHREECYQNIQPEMKYSPEHVGKALRKERIGGLAYINLCADGETLLLKDFDLYAKEMVKQGHYLEIITNLTVTSVLERILLWDKELLRRIEFKCSFHYLELKKRNLLEIFSENVKKIWAAGASASIEITPSDELIPYLDEVKTFSVREFGALPHITIARDDRTKEIDYLTELPMEEYDKIWKTFESDFWKYKKEIFKVKRDEFCYAGLWSLYINLTNGVTKPCYCGQEMDNFFENIDKEYNFKPLGYCSLPHCFNGHAFLTLGLIPDLESPGYGNLRNRQKANGENWLQSEMHSFINTKCSTANDRLNFFEKKYYRFCSKKYLFIIESKKTIKKMLKKLGVKRFGN